MTNMTLFEARVRKCVNEITYDIEYIINNVLNSDNYLNEIKKIIDDMNAGLIAEYQAVINPYAWKEL